MQIKELIKRLKEVEKIEPNSTVWLRVGDSIYLDALRGDNQ